MNTESNIKRRGRPAGSNSFVRVRVADLVRLLGNNVSVPVSKVWLRENGIEATQAVSMVVPQVAEEPQENQPKIEFSLTSFD
jgi:hypothetical protein